LGYSGKGSQQRGKDDFGHIEGKGEMNKSTVDFFKGKGNGEGEEISQTSDVLSFDDIKGLLENTTLGSQALSDRNYPY
jgi:hypothetical protein